jgi:hypothetical protein
MSIPDAAIEAAAQVMRGMRSYTYDTLARAAIEAAMPAIREGIAQEIEAMSVLDTDRQQPRTLGAKQVRGRAARIVRGDAA